MPHILIVEDEAAIADTLVFALQGEGFTTTWLSLAEAALEFQQRTPADLLILDVGLPDMSGFEACKQLRRSSEVPVLFLTARNAEIDRVVGLEIGADDYVTKPFGMMELISRIKAVLRRSGKQQDKTKLSVGGISLDTKKHEVKVDGEQVVLTLKEFELLEKLMRNQGIVLTRDQLLTEIWGYDFDGETRTVDVHIRTLRQKLGEQGSLVKTVRGVGYRIGGEA